MEEFEQLQQFEHNSSFSILANPHTCGYENCELYNLLIHSVMKQSSKCLGCAMQHELIKLMSNNTSQSTQFSGCQKGCSYIKNEM